MDKSGFRTSILCYHCKCISAKLHMKMLLYNFYILVHDEDVSSFGISTTMEEFCELHNQGHTNEVVVVTWATIRLRLE